MRSKTSSIANKTYKDMIVTLIPHHPLLRKRLEAQQML